MSAEFNRAFTYEKQEQISRYSAGFVRFLVLKTMSKRFLGAG